MLVYLSIDQALRLHREQIATYGGGSGLRERGLLEAALARPAMTFGGDDLYPDIPSKAAAQMHSIVMNHPFVDGNERVGAHAAVVFVMANGWVCLATPEELIDVTLGVAEGKVQVEALAIWFRQRLRAVD